MASNSAAGSTVNINVVEDKATADSIKQFGLSAYIDALNIQEALSSQTGTDVTIKEGGFDFPLDDYIGIDAFYTTSGMKVLLRQIYTYTGDLFCVITFGGLLEEDIDMATKAFTALH